jgi:uncharacterized membrane protein
VANGKQEAAVLQQIGSSKDAARTFKQDTAIGRATKKPTVSNGFRALIAVLSVLSLPLLVSLVTVAIALLVAVVALFAGGLSALAWSIAAAVLGTIDMASIVFTGNAPFYLLLLVAGAAIIVGTLALELMRGLVSVGRRATRSAIRTLTSRHTKRKQQTHPISSEER